MLCFSFKWSFNQGRNAERPFINESPVTELIVLPLGTERGSTALPNQTLTRVMMAITKSCLWKGTGCPSGDMKAQPLQTMSREACLWIGVHHLLTAQKSPPPLTGQFASSRQIPILRLLCLGSSATHQSSRPNLHLYVSLPHLLTSTDAGTTLKDTGTAKQLPWFTERQVSVLKAVAPV